MRQIREHLAVVSCCARMTLTFSAKALLFFLLNVCQQQNEANAYITFHNRAFLSLTIKTRELLLPYVLLRS